ncbi:hypothetical protein D9M68_822640 [compost metagenome]
MGAAAGNRFATCRTAGENLWLLFLKPEEELFIVDQAVLDHFGIAGGELTGAEGVERRKIGQHQFGLVEGANEVLAMGRIDAGLAADRAIDLRQKRGRHLHEIHATPSNGGGKAGEIANDTATERNHQIAALQPRRQNAFHSLPEQGPGFG